MANIDLFMFNRFVIKSISCSTCSTVGWINWSLRFGSSDEFEEMTVTSLGWCNSVIQDKVLSMSYPVL